MAEPGAEQPAETVLTQQQLKLNSQRRPTKPSVATATGGGRPTLSRVNKGEKV